MVGGSGGRCHCWWWQLPLLVVVAFVAASCSSSCHYCWAEAALVRLLLLLLLREAQPLEVIVLVHGLILREAVASGSAPSGEVAAVQLGPLEGYQWPVLLQPAVVRVEVVVMVVVVVRQVRGVVEALGVRLLLLLQHGDWVSIGVQAGPGGVALHPARVVHRQHHPLAATRVHASWTWRPLLLLCNTFTSSFT